jgi:hypothetical protein
MMGHSAVNVNVDPSMCGVSQASYNLIEALGSSQACWTSANYQNIYGARYSKSDVTLQYFFEAVDAQFFGIQSGSGRNGRGDL